MLISGSLRQRSTNTAALRTARLVAPRQVAAVLYEGTARLPHFNPDDDTGSPPAPVLALRAQIRSADAVLFSVPEYAGALPGSFKNLLDWAVGDDQPASLDGKPVAWVNVAPRGAVHAHDSLRRVLRYLGARVVEPACADLPLAQTDLDAEGLVQAAHIRARLAAVLEQLSGAAPVPAWLPSRTPRPVRFLSPLGQRRTSRRRTREARPWPVYRAGGRRGTPARR